MWLILQARCAVCNILYISIQFGSS